MEKREELPFHVKRAIVQRLAQYETPSEVVKACKEDFALELSRQRVSFYDPTTKAGAALDPELKALFEATREAFLEDVDSIPIANKAVRLRHLQRQLEFFSGKNAAGIVLQLLEAAAKEMGGAFTNRRELSGPGGGPIRTAVGVHDLSDDELTAIARSGRDRAAAPAASPDQPAGVRKLD